MEFILRTINARWQTAGSLVLMTHWIMYDMNMYHSTEYWIKPQTQYLFSIFRLPLSHSIQVNIEKSFSLFRGVVKVTCLLVVVSRPKNIIFFDLPLIQYRWYLFCFDWNTTKIVNMSVDSTADSDLDTIFAEVGEFGIYQIAIYLLICIPNALSATFVMNYMFTANTLGYRWVI